MTSTAASHFPMGRSLHATAALLALLAGAGVARAQAPEEAPREPLVLPAADSRPDSRPAPFARYSSSAERLRDSVVALARAQIGKRYVYGATNPKRGFDCSGLVLYIAKALNIDLPRTANQQARVGRALARDTAQLRPGDLVTFANGRSRRISHIGIYIGGGKIIHASSHSGRVVEAPLIKARSSLTRRWRGAVRVLADETPVEGDESGGR